MVVDGQGGGLGKQLVMAIKSSLKEASVIAVGTNSLATNTMLKSGADFAATGENAVIVNARKADIIMGPIAIVIADALHGEITPAMAVAIGQSQAKRIILPMNHCDNVVVGDMSASVGELITQAIRYMTESLENQ